jgi:hypothetical protein
MRIRVATAADVAAVITFPPDPVVGAIATDQLRQEYAENRMRPEWTWLAEQSKVLVGRAMWWGRTDSVRPLSLDYLEVLPGVDDPAQVGAELLAAAHTGFAAGGVSRPPEYAIRLPAGWRDDDDGHHQRADGRGTLKVSQRHARPSFGKRARPPQSCRHGYPVRRRSLCLRHRHR